jgi:calcium/calmodulin-dependent protein kinase I
VWFVCDVGIVLFCFCLPLHSFYLGFATVWTANPISDTEKEYAVKVVDRNIVREKDCNSVFREVKILNELKDLPNVITIIDFMVEPQYLYVVQSYACGGDLFHRLTKRKQYTEKDARDIVVVLFQTLDDMHTKYQITHRDLKPENLLLEDLIIEKVYLADFGFARKLTKEGLKTRCETPAFVAPEIVLGRVYNQSVDMWSIGVILFMMLGGYNPFSEGTGDLRTLFRKVRAGDFTFHQSQWKNVSPEAKCLISRLLTVDPNYRHTAGQALKSGWVQKIDAKALLSNNLSDSLTVLKSFDGRLTLKVRNIILLLFLLIVKNRTSILAPPCVVLRCVRYGITSSLNIKHCNLYYLLPFFIGHFVSRGQ